MEIKLRACDEKQKIMHYDFEFIRSGTEGNVLTCSCGGGNGPDHILGEGKCFRKLATGNLIPKNFRDKYGRQMSSTEKNIMTADHEVLCDVNDITITLYILKEQRMYSQYKTGEWSLPKDESSTNSLEVI